MKRKEFLRQLGLLTGGVAVGLDGVPMRAYAYNPVMMDLAGTNGKIVVLVQLSGGNDGLNTVIPYEDSIYYTKRPNIGIQKANAIPLTNTLGLNPAMGALKNLYEEDKVSIIQAVGYDNHNRSHFRSTDIWMSASDANQVVAEGWMGRYLAKTFPDYPAKLPDQPMAVHLGSVESMLLLSQAGSMGTVFDDPNTFYQLVNGSTADNDPPPATIAGDELKFLKAIAAQSIQYSGVIKDKADKGKNAITYPNTNFARQLSIVAKLISGGIQTPVYLTTLGGFDTHASQLTQHANLLKTLSDAVASFQLDLDTQGLSKDVVVMTFSEFGRRLNQNGTTGTDHGAAAVHFVIGKSVKGGIIGGEYDLVNLDSSGDIKNKYDYRQIYTAVLRDHLGMSQADAQNLLFKDFQKLPIFRVSAQANDQVPSFELFQPMPNPVSTETRIKYRLNKSQEIRLSVMDLLGHEVGVLRQGVIEEGTYFETLNARSFSNGMYLLSLEGDGSRQTLRMMIER
ncbi:MAG: DUF1501 domain-containing protein [Spirosomataceae bacterium]